MHGMGEFTVSSSIFFLNYFDEHVTSSYQELKTAVQFLTQSLY